MMAIFRKLGGKSVLLLIWGCFFLEVVSTACSSPLPLPTLAPAATVPLMPNLTATPSPIYLPVTFTSTPEVITGFTPVLTVSPSPVVYLSPTPLPTATIHIVAKDETLLEIAIFYNIDLSLILQVNPEISNPNDIGVGQQIVIPPFIDDTSTNLPVHYVKAGENFTTISTYWNIEVSALQKANPQVDPNSLQVGQPLFIPVSDAHWTISGDTLSQLAVTYNTSIDAIIEANLDVLDPANPDYVPTGVLLKIPPEQVSEGYDCNPQPARTIVITYTINYGEKEFCLASKFGISIETLYAANPHLIGEGVVHDGVVVVVPPLDGTVYTVTAEDVTRNTTLQDLLEWYGITQFTDIQDWAGQLVGPTLQTGQQLFIRGADLLAGPFDSSFLVVVQEPTPIPTIEAGTAVFSTPGVVAAQPTASVPSNSSTPGYEPPVPTGDPPPGAFRPHSNPWSGELTSVDTGWCGGVADGSGWSDSLIWPINNPVIHENRGFRPGHHGIDLDAPLGTSIYASATGQVVWAGYTRWGGGNMVVLAHGNTWQTHYAHMDDIFVSCGQIVTQGTIIGTIGQTGSSSFPHVHLELRYGGFAYDPTEWLP